MKKGNWIPIDKRFVKLLPMDRPYTLLEAMFSYSVDRDNKHKGTIAGYSALWQWSRNKVRRFISAIRDGNDYLSDTHRTGSDTGKRQAVRYVFNNLQGALIHPQDTPQDTHEYTTKDPDPLSLNPTTKKEYKGAIQGDKSLSFPLSFLKYLQTKDKGVNRIEEAKTVQFYLDAYRASRGDEHPHLKAHQWDEVMDFILVAQDSDNDREAVVDYEAMTEVIAKHFQTEYQKGCDYNILHFISGSGKIIYLRACECGYY